MTAHDVRVVAEQAEQRGRPRSLGADDHEGGLVCALTGTSWTSGPVGGALAYDVLLTRDKSGKPLNGVMQLLLAGTSTRGAETTAALKPVAISLDRYESVRGRLPLPDGFTPKQTTVQVLDRPAAVRHRQRGWPVEEGVARGVHAFDLAAGVPVPLEIVEQRPGAFELTLTEPAEGPVLLGLPARARRRAGR